jgi:hypothetical protein
MGGTRVPHKVEPKKEECKNMSKKQTELEALRRILEERHDNNRNRFKHVRSGGTIPSVLGASSLLAEWLKYSPV